MLRPTESPTLFLQQLGRGLRKTSGKPFCTVLGLRRHAPQGVPLRPPLSGAARRFSARRRTGGPAPVPVPAGRLPHAPRRQGVRDRPAQPARRDPDPMAGQGRRAAFASPRPARPRTRRVPARVRSRSRRRLRRQQELVGSPRGGRRTDTRARAPTRRCSVEPSDGSCTSTTANASTPTERLLARRRRRPSIDCPERERRLLHMLVAARHRSCDHTRHAPSRKRSTCCGPTRKCVPSCWSCSACSTAGSTTSTLRSRRIRTARCRSTPATAGSRSSPRSASAPGAKIAAWQSGVYEAKAANAELLAFTLDKSSGGFSPTTRYRDYAISRTLIHWESQSSTRGRQRDRPALPQPRA